MCSARNVQTCIMDIVHFFKGSIFKNKTEILTKAAKSTSFFIVALNNFRKSKSLKRKDNSF